MSYAATLGLVLLAVYGLASVLLSLLVAVSWRARLESKPSSSRTLLGLRLLPGAGSSFLAVFLVLPAFLIREPDIAAEPVGALLMLSATLSAISIGCGALRVWRAWTTAGALLHGCGRPVQTAVIAGRQVEVIDVPDGIVAVVGVLRPRIVVAAGVLAACSPAEIREIIGHEWAHISAKDNLKLLLLMASPDALAWLPAGRAMTARWRAAVEFEADARATGADPRKRVALASALVKVARLSLPRRPLVGISMPIAVDDVSGRVRRLLAPLQTPDRSWRAKALAACTILMAVVAVPLYGTVQELVETLVAFGT
jgi:Zn-dependent protease with chaperone function